MNIVFYTLCMVLFAMLSSVGIISAYRDSCGISATLAAVAIVFSHAFAVYLGHIVV